MAAAAGWVSFLGIVGGLILIPTLIAGQPPTASTPLPQAMAYFAHRDLIGVSALLAVFVGGMPIVPFAIGLRELFGDGSDAAHDWAEIAFFLLIATLPVYVVSGAIGGALATPAAADPTVFAPLHQLYQLLYNGAADVLEGAWIGAFGLAAVLGARSGSTRAMGWLGIALGFSRWLKAFVAVGAMTDAVIPVSGLLFVGWFLAVVVALSVRAFRSDAVGIRAAAPAG
jgi:hypothetical protein